MSITSYTACGSRVLRTIDVELDAVRALARTAREPGFQAAVADAVDAMAAAEGRIILTGMGKSGVVARKISGTMTSTGSPSTFLHPGDASHGDLGVITRGDVVLALSWSGDTAELGPIINHCRRWGVPLVVMTAHPGSMAGAAADICLALPRVAEACPHQLAPTASSTVQMVMGDALAMALLERRDFSLTDFLTLHPGGSLGERLVTVGRLMGRGDAVPCVALEATLADAAVEMSGKRYGATAVVAPDGSLVGAFTDGDLRRSFAAARRLDDRVEAHMSRPPLAVPPEMLASEALRLMNANAVSMLFVCRDRRLIGAIHVHDVLRAGIA